MATQLLESLLSDQQLADYRADGVFWVDTAHGPVRLGHRYDLRHITLGGIERSLCVIPDTWELLPDADVWATLLLWLNTEPDRFFRVAIRNPGLPDDLPLSRTPRPICSPTPGMPRGSDLADILSAELQRMENRSRGVTDALNPPTTGLAPIDAALAGLRRGHVALVVGAPGSGKTALAVGTALRTAAGSRCNHDDGDPMREEVLYCAPLGEPLAIARALIAHDAMVRREDLLHQSLSQREWHRVVDAFADLSAAPLQIDAGSRTPAEAWPSGAAETPTALVVVDDAAALPGDLTHTVGRARELGYERDAPVILITSVPTSRGDGPDLGDLPAGIADQLDVVVSIAPRGPGRVVTPTTVSVLKNRVGPRAECRGVLVNGWGRVLAILPPG